MTSKKKTESVHVRLDSPIAKRRMILQTTIDSVALLKRYENIKRIKEEKEKGHEEFKKVLRSINFLVKQIKMQDLPLDSDDLKKYKVKTKKEPSLVQPIVKKIKKVVGKQKEEKKPMLDRQLDELQRKLQRL